MLRIFTRDNANELVAYHEDDLTDEDIGQTETGRSVWIGQAAVRLGLTGKVGHTAFRRLSRNQDPRTGRKLTQRNSRNRRAAYDCVLSAPKSASIMALVMDDARIIGAHAEATTETIVEMEKVAMARVRRQGADADRVTGNLIGASFEHFLSREDDPQLHTHKVIFNVTWDAIEATWKALQPVEFYARSSFFTAFYRHRLAAKLHLLGYETRRTARSLEIKGVPKEVIDTFSKRHAEIDRREAELGSSGNAKLRAGIAQRCRRPKDRGVGNMDDLRRSWKAQVTPEQWSQLERLKAAARRPIRPKRLSAARAIRVVSEHLFERLSAARPHELLAEAMMVSDGQLDLGRLEQALAADQHLHHSGGFVFSRKETLAAFRLCLFIQNGIKTARPLVAAPALSADLDQEQRQALENLLACRDRVMQLRGPAGSGKTTIQKELVRLLNAARRPVIIVAPTTAAVGVLREAGFAEAMTLPRFLGAERDRRLMEGSVIILDEAGLVSVAQMEKLSAAAHRLQARVILVGDTRQHTSVEAGDALRILEEHSRLHRVDLTTIHRQTCPQYRAVVEQLRDGDTEAAFRSMDKRGWIKEVIDEEQRHGLLAERYVACRRSSRSALVVCATWREGRAVNECIRRALRDAGLIGREDHAAQTLAPLHLTVAQRKQPHYYEPGQVITFHRTKDGFSPLWPVTVARVEAWGVIVRTAHGLELPLSLRRCAKVISVFTPQPINLAAGDLVLILENYRFRDPGNADLCNGDLATVGHIAPSGDIFLIDGRMIPAHFRHFTHGYAVTSQRAQAQTVDEVFLAIDAASALCAARAKTFYVGVSRGRERGTIFTDDKELLLRAFSRSGERLGAFDLIPKAKP